MASYGEYDACQISPAVEWSQFSIDDLIDISRSHARFRSTLHFSSPSFKSSLAFQRLGFHIDCESKCLRESRPLSGGRRALTTRERPSQLLHREMIRHGNRKWWLRHTRGQEHFSIIPLVIMNCEGFSDSGQEIILYYDLEGLSFLQSSCHDLIPFLFVTGNLDRHTEAKTWKTRALTY